VLAKLEPREVPSTLRPALDALPPRIQWSLYQMEIYRRVIALKVDLNDREVCSQMVWDIRESELDEHPCILTIRLAEAVRVLEGRLAAHVS